MLQVSLEILVQGALLGHLVPQDPVGSQARRVYPLLWVVYKPDNDVIILVDLENI
jgi:hypothetical protein